jgi:tetratricopeptide (TPR) repeat protein
MKKILIVITALALIAGFYLSDVKAADSINWMYEVETAQQLAREHNKDLLVLAKTDWDELSNELLKGPLSDSAVIQLSGGFICLQVSVLDKDFIKRYNVTQYPTVLFLSSAGNDFAEIDRISGLQEASVYIAKMKDILANKSTLLSLKEKAAAENIVKLSREEQIKTLRSLGQLMIAQSKLADARDAYERLIRLDSSNKNEYQAQLDFISALKEVASGNLNKAEEILSSLDGADYEFELIRLKLAKGKQKEAFKNIDEFLSKYPADERSGFLMDTQASYYFQVGRYKKGLDMFIQILRDYPKTPYARRARELIETMIVWPPRRQQLYQVREVENIVYIVPDIKTYLYYISLWDSSKIYPVLLEGSKLNDKFIEAFKPKEVKKVRSALVPGNVDEAMVYRSLYTSWNEEDILTQVKKDYSKDDIKEFFDSNGHIPAGMVLYNLNSGEMAGGLALASARLQALDSLPYVKKGERVINVIEMRSLKDKIEMIIKSWDYPYKGQLDGIDYITIAGDFPYAYDYKQTTSPGRYALDDALCRNDEAKRDAYVGRLIGGFNESIYQAMCSIFLQPEDILFFNSYDSKGTWLNYRTDLAAGMLSGGFDVTNIDKGEATLDRWHILTQGAGNVYDLVIINSSGGPSDWNLSGSKGTTEDVPESVAAVVVYTHSNSAANPYDENTIAGRWLKNGAYIYFGSVSEPYVQSFKTPSEIAADLLFGRPFSESLRKDSGSWSSPWKLIYIGDPMYGLMPKAPRVDTESIIKQVR